MFSDLIIFSLQCSILGYECRPLLRGSEGSDVQGSEFNNFLHNLSTVCSEKLDLMFALDDSSRVSEKNFLKVRNFAKNLLSSFSLDDGQTQVGAMSYSDNANLAFGFGKVAGKSLKEMQELVQAIPYTGKSESRLDKAFSLATQELLLKGRQGGGVKKVAIISYNPTSNFADRIYRIYRIYNLTLQDFLQGIDLLEA